jgi:hypothetical protein
MEKKNGNKDRAGRKRENVHLVSVFDFLFTVERVANLFAFHFQEVKKQRDK